MVEKWLKTIDFAKAINVRSAAKFATYQLGMRDVVIRQQIENTGTI